MKKIYPVLILALVLVFSGCIEDVLKETITSTTLGATTITTTVTTTSIRAEIEFIEQRVEYDLVGYLTEINGKLAYLAKKDNKGFIVYDGKEGKRYDYVEFEYLTEINGKLVFAAKKNDVWYIVREK